MYIEIALACALKGVVFETIHQIRSRSLLRQERLRGPGPKHSANIRPTPYLTAQLDKQVRTIEQRSR
jgi:hypothetical protein